MKLNTPELGAYFKGYSVFFEMSFIFSDEIWVLVYFIRLATTAYFLVAFAWLPLITLSL